MGDTTHPRLGPPPTTSHDENGDGPPTPALLHVPSWGETKEGILPFQRRGGENGDGTVMGDQEKGLYFGHKMNE